MPGRVDAPVTSSLDDAFAAQHSSEPVAPSKPTAPTERSSSVEAHAGEPQWCSDNPAGAPAEAAEAQSVAELQRASQREQASRARASSALQSELRPALGALRARSRDPAALNQDELRWGIVEGLNTGVAHEALGKLPRGVAEVALRSEVSRAWPQATPSQVNELTARLSALTNEHLRTNAAFQMRDLVATKMNGTASELEKLATDPAALKAIIGELSALASGPAAERQEFASLSAGLGLDTPAPLTRLDTKSVAGRLQARAKLLRNESGALQRVGADRLFRELAVHDVRTAFMKQSGIEPGSWLGTQVDAARTQGEAERTNLERVKVGTAIAAAALTSGLGGTFVLGSSTAAALGSLSAYNAGRALDVARAGESAGTMPQGSAEVAEWNRKVAVGAAVVSVVVPGAVAGAAEKGALDGLEHLVGHSASHALVEGGLETTIQAAESKLHHHAPTLIEPGGVAHFNTNVGARVLDGLPAPHRKALDSAMRDEMQKLGLPAGSAQEAALFGFLAQEGGRLGGLDGRAIAQRFAAYLPSAR